jgi:hypothetical protein
LKEVCGADFNNPIYGDLSNNNYGKDQYQGGKKQGCAFVVTCVAPKIVQNYNAMKYFP